METKSLQLLASIDGEGTSLTTTYLFEKEEKTLLVITSPTKPCPTDCRLPTIYSTLLRVLAATGFALAYVKIYRYLDDVYYAYLGIADKTQEYERRDFGLKAEVSSFPRENTLISELKPGIFPLEINCEVHDAIYLAQHVCAPIYAESFVLKEQGITITKELLENALAKDGDEEVKGVQ